MELGFRWFCLEQDHGSDRLKAVFLVIVMKKVISYSIGVLFIATMMGLQIVPTEEPQKSMIGIVVSVIVLCVVKNADD
jgi:hypothetical protein